MIILGIDPALSKLGWGIIEDRLGKLIYLSSGIIKTKTTEPIHKRLAIISSNIEELLISYRPDMVAMEETFINKNASSSLTLGFARGAVMALIGKHDLPFQEFKPNTIKKTVVGVGHAEKEQVLHMVKLLISGTPNITNLDESDALAVAYTTYVYRNQSLSSSSA